MLVSRHLSSVILLAVCSMLAATQPCGAQAADQNADQVIIKEIYCGGVMKDDGSDNFHFDKCIILYNNCPEQAVVSNLAFGISACYNAEAPTEAKNYVDGKLVYEDEGFIPAQNGIWYFPGQLVVEPFTQVVVCVHGAIDNTQTVSNSVNYANSEYYCMYDPATGGGGSSESNNYYNNPLYYPSPSDVIPTTHYLKTVKYGMANAWTFSVTSPAVFIFQTRGVDVPTFGNDADNLWYVPGNGQSSAWACLKVPNEWILDGVEVYNAQKLDDSKKRLTADIDAGYVAMTNKLGHVLYRNVDKELTEARPENAGKLVYNYSLGTGESTDPSGIDAEASMRNGAHIVFQDTNNSSADFHERLQCSLRDAKTTGIVSLPAGENSAPMTVSTIDGRIVSTRAAATEALGNAVPENLSRGIYVVRTPGRSYKVAK